MKKHLLFLCFIPLAGAVALPAAAEDVPSLVVHHWYGNDHYPVALTDYNKIKIGENNYTLQSPSGKPDITLDSKTYPRFSVENVSSDNVVTSQQQVADNIASPALTYCQTTQSLIAASADADFTITVFNAAGQQVLSGNVAEGHELSVASLPAGIYFAVANNSNTNLTLKFAKH